MDRIDIINEVGKEYVVSNIEAGEFSYLKGLREIGKNLSNYLIPEARREYRDIDIRFVHNGVTVLVETKYKFVESELKANMEQLQQYVIYETELTGNEVVAILASICSDEIYVWNDGTNKILEINRDKMERTIKPFDEYYDMYFGTKNNKEAIVKNTYELNEILHNYSIRESIRSQFVGTCLLSLKNGLQYKGLSNKQIRAGIEDVLTNLLNKDLNKAFKLSILKNKVVDSQNVRDLKKEEFEHILREIENKILPFINYKPELFIDFQKTS